MRDAQPYRFLDTRAVRPDPARHPVASGFFRGESMTVLSDELTNDPLGRGYSAMTDQEVVDSLNAVDRPRDRTSMSGREVAAGIDNAEYDALGDVQKSQVLALVASDDLDPFGLAANVIKDIFTAGSATVLALAAARVETVSRAVELGLSRVRAGTVAEAR